RIEPIAGVCVDVKVGFAHERYCSPASSLELGPSIWLSALRTKSFRLPREGTQSRARAGCRALAAPAPDPAAAPRRESRRLPRVLLLPCPRGCSRLKSEALRHASEPHVSPHVRHLSSSSR